MTETSFIVPGAVVEFRFTSTVVPPRTSISIAFDPEAGSAFED